MRILIFSIFITFACCNSALSAEQIPSAQSPLLMIPPTAPHALQLPQDIGDSRGYSPDEELIYRINFGRADDVKLLLDKGANPNARTKQGDPVLSVAVDRNDSEAVGMVKALLDKGADPNEPDREKNYPIVSATKNGQVEMVAALIDKGADFQARSPSGTSILELAKINGNQELIKIIQGEIDKENKFASDARTPARYKKILVDYANDNCLYEYWGFFYSSRQETAADAETQKKIKKYKTAISLLIKQIQRYYAFTSTATLESLSMPVSKEIATELNDMISNSNRREHGVGKEGDDEMRCNRIIEHINFNNISVPANYMLPDSNATK